MRSVCAVFSALLFSMSLPAISASLPKDYDPAETRCSGFDDAALKIFSGQLDYAEQVLPNIPPEEDRYLTAESAAAQKVYMEELEQNNWKPPAQGQGSMRFAALQARPLYSVWGVRKDLVDAKRAIAGILKEGGGPARSYRKNPEAEKLERAARAWPHDRVRSAYAGIFDETIPRVKQRNGSHAGTVGTALQWRPHAK